MKVLINNYNDTIEHIKKDVDPYPRELTCEDCGSVLEYEKSDLEMGVFGCMHLKCPLCGRNNMVEDNEDTITLTKDNVEFPTHFFHTSKENAEDCCNNEEIKKCINKAIDFFRKNKDEYSWCAQYGNFYVDVERCVNDGEQYRIIVTNDYYETCIPFESEDYETNNCECCSYR